MWPLGRKASRKPATGAAAEDSAGGTVSASAAKRGDLGPRGEKLALKFLKKQGLKLLARNYRCPGGEADLIMLDAGPRRRGGRETIAFVEVKTRSSEDYTAPESAVNAPKQARMRKIAAYYRAMHDTTDFDVRFDIVAIVIRPGEQPVIRHTAGAF